MHQSEFHEHVGELNICPSIEAALERARRFIEMPSEGGSGNRVIG
jgi:hypothetical protein